MLLHLSKYHGTGNDFILLDNRNGEISLSKEDIAGLCHRRFSLGADGLMLLESSAISGFKMRYFNSDGLEGSMCGNGGRVISAFSRRLGIECNEFEAIDGLHHFDILNIAGNVTNVCIEMTNVEKVAKISPNSYFLDTGSPHLVIFVDDIENCDVEKEGKYWRHHPDFTNGTNVNFVEIKHDSLYVRTYERGVEAETYACGTGVVASSIAAYVHNNEQYIHKVGVKFGKYIKYGIKTLGGELKVDFMRRTEENRVFSEIHLTGPAAFVYDCKVEI